MITLSVLGGLGNQMFQYAAGKALAERHGVDLALDLSGFTDTKLTPRPFLLDRLRVPEASAFSAQAEAQKAAGYYARAAWRKRIARVIGRVGLPKLEPLDYTEPHFHYDPTFETLGPHTTVWGYFQSERYFSSIAEDLREWFLPRESLTSAAAEMLSRIEASRLPISVHVRRGDYLDPGRVEFHGIVVEPYYREALDRLEGAIGAAAELFVFSDDPAAAEQVLNFVPRSRLVNVRGEPDRPWEDMALMARCRHHIIANSSFSWWGAWLNGAPEKVVVAPRNWFAPGQRRMQTSDLYPPAWLLV
jgi:hypothetical protein